MTTPTPSPGQALAALRRTVSGTCQRCGKPTSGYPSKKWCGNACRVAAYQERKKVRNKPCSYGLP